MLDNFLQFYTEKFQIYLVLLKKILIITSSASKMITKYKLKNWRENQNQNFLNFLQEVLNKSIPDLNQWEY